jgi:hypothetical protein
VRNNGLQHLEIELPAGAKVWSAFVGGEAVRPALSQGKLLLPLEAATTDADAPVAVELTYVGSEKFPKGRGLVNLASPQLGVPLKNARWDLYLPPDYDYQQFGGSMTHEAQAAPTVQSYSLSEYNAQEAEKKQLKASNTKDFISNVRRKLANGDVNGINSSSSYDNYSTADAGTRAELEGLKRDVENIQGNNLSQQQRVFNNSGNFGAGMTLANTANAQALANTANDMIARDQWNRLAQAQELAVARVRPLRVNLPTRGLHQAFTQVLQTEIEKPLTIHFTAANARSGGWFRWLLGGVLAFLALWVLVKALLAPAERDSQTT